MGAVIGTPHVASSREHRIAEKDPHILVAASLPSLVTSAPFTEPSQSAHGIRPPNHGTQAQKNSRNKSYKVVKSQSDGSQKSLANSVFMTEAIKQQTKVSKEYPDPFWVFDPEKYREYEFRCSRGQNPTDFFRHCFEHHYRAGHFNDEFGGEQAALDAYWRVVDASPAMHDVGNPNYEDLRYNAKLKALWGDLRLPETPSCREPGSHAKCGPPQVPKLHAIPKRATRTQPSGNTIPMPVTTAVSSHSDLHADSQPDHESVASTAVATTTIATNTEKANEPQSVLSVSEDILSLRATTMELRSQVEMMSQELKTCAELIKTQHNDLEKFNARVALLEVRQNISMVTGDTMEPDFDSFLNGSCYQESPSLSPTAGTALFSDANTGRFDAHTMATEATSLGHATANDKLIDPMSKIP